MGKSKKSIAVLSGGLDSTVSVAYLKDTHQIHALTFNYGQQCAEMEIKASKNICKSLGLKHTPLDLRWMAGLGQSALTSSEPVPEIRMDELDNKKICVESARKVWVPGRNIVFTAIATSFAEAEGAESIIVGWNLEEAETFPDNSKKFLNSFNNLLKVGALQNIEIKAPLIDLNKNEIVKFGAEINAPLNLSYSCYLGGKEHCGSCESCMRRKRAFLTAGIIDSTVYKE